MNDRVRGIGLHRRHHRVAVRQVEILHVHALVFNAQTIQLLTDIIAQLSAHARYQYLHSACPRFPYIFS